MIWQTYLAVMVGGGLGAGARFFLANLASHHFGQVFPWGTLIVNVSGCFLIGLFIGLTGPYSHSFTSPIFRQMVAIGVLGGYTTFSSFSLQTINMLSQGEFLYGGMNIALSLVLCLVGTWGGLILAGLIQSR